jgi:hypothetical protein
VLIELPVEIDSAVDNGLAKDLGNFEGSGTLVLHPHSESLKLKRLVGGA